MSNEYRNNNLFTFTGIPAEEIPKRLSELFTDKKAYKDIQGSLGLTDINTGYMIERVTEVFGPKGLGWNLHYDSQDMIIEGDIVVTRKPSDALPVAAWLKYAIFSYNIYNEEGNLIEPCSVITSGVSINKWEYAEEGARTTALGAAIKGLCFQLGVYKGELDDGKRPGGTSNSQTSGSGKQSGASKAKKNNAPAAENEKAAEKEKVAEESTNEDKTNGTTFDINTLDEHALKSALAYKIPTTLPKEGLTFEDAIAPNNIDLGRQVISYLAGKIKGPRTKKLFVPANDDEIKLQKAALYVYIHKGLAPEKKDNKEQQGEK